MIAKQHTVSNKDVKPTQGPPPPASTEGAAEHEQEAQGPQRDSGTEPAVDTWRWTVSVLLTPRSGGAEEKPKRPLNKGSDGGTNSSVSLCLQIG